MKMNTMRNMTIRVMMSVAAVAVVTTLGACQTVKGVGQDVKNLGEAGEDAIKK